MMDKVKALFKSKSVVTIIAVSACLIILYVAYNYRVKQKTNPISVPYAVKDIDARTEVTDDMIGTVKMASSMVSSNVIIDKTNIIGKFVNYNTFIPAGSLFYSSVLVNWETMPDSAWSDIETGHTIVSLTVNTEMTFGNSIFPKDKIDLYLKTNDPTTSKLVYGKLIEGITVLAVKDKNGNHIFRKSAEQQQASALIFSVPEDMHLLLRKALFLGGEIIPVPRNASYNAEVNISSSYLRTLVETQSLDVPLDDQTDDNHGDGEVKVTE